MSDSHNVAGLPPSRWGRKSMLCQLQQKHASATMCRMKLNATADERLHIKAENRGAGEEYPSLLIRLAASNGSRELGISQPIGCVPCVCLHAEG